MFVHYSAGFLFNASVKVLFFFFSNLDSYFPILVPSVHSEWNKQEVNELVSGRAWLDRWHGIYLVACFPSVWLSPQGQFETFNLVSKLSSDADGWTIHDGFRHAADIVYFRLDATISVDIGAWKNLCAHICVPLTSLELISTKSVEPCDADLHLLRTVFLIWLGRKGGDERAIFFSFFLDAYLAFFTLVYTCGSSYSCYINPSFCLKLHNTASRIPYREAGSYKTYLQFSVFCLIFCPLQRKWVSRLGFLIMRKPLLQFTFS